MLYLPLDKLMAQTAASDVKGVPPAVTLPPELMESARPQNSRSRESSTNREGR
jgi:membrane protease subunit HflK